jgi:hypothetical protein
VTLSTKDLSNALRSHAAELGVFERVGGSQPKNAPGNGLTYAVWPDDISPSAKSSGLGTVSANVVYFGRIYQPAEAMPFDDIEDEMLVALDTLLAAYCGDFTLGGLIRCVDILGAEGTDLNAKSGWVRFDDGLYRVITITIPMIVNDAWVEEA